MPLHLERRGHIAVLTLDDPPRRNALSRNLVTACLAALEQSRREGARAVIIAASGKVFCAGANIDDLKSGWMSGADDPTDPVRLFRALAEDSRPTIAAVQGGALGGGCELTLSCDLVVAGPAAYFCLPELGHGVIPNTGVARLQQVVGARRAREIIMTRRKVGAEEALAIGLVNRLEPTRDLVESAMELAETIIGGCPPGALTAAKHHIAAHGATDWERVLSSPRDVPSVEWQEGLRAFDERRKPDYEQFWAALTP
jgi:enoyl-CoA hydratase